MDASGSSVAPEPRKRRRPPLSCVQCRRRKVKCDRNLPCNRCIQSKDTLCVYDPETPTRARTSHHTTNSSLGHTSSTLLSNQQDHSTGSRESTFLNTPVDAALSVLDIRSPTGNMSWAAGAAQFAEHASSERGCESIISPRISQSEPSMQELKDRIRDLEMIVSRSVTSGPSPTENNSTTTHVLKLQGNIDKTRFFGMSHWMNTKEEV
jgi:hypothetical protein